MLTILEFPDARLRKKAQRIETVTGSTADLADQMLSAMYEAPGIGLAAVQIGILKRVIVIDLSKDVKKKEPIFFCANLRSSNAARKLYPFPTTKKTTHRPDITHYERDNEEYLTKP